MKFRFCWLLLLITMACSKKNTPANTPPPTTPSPRPITDLGWTFETTPVWKDEFDEPGALNVSRWSYDVGGHGWGNNEQQYYTEGDANAKVSNGILTIEALPETKDNRSYTSARVVTKGKGDFLYGRIEVRAKLPGGKGSWPAIWMLPTDNTYGTWPASGEIDIMEHVGYDPNRVHCTVHTTDFNHSKGTQRGNSMIVPTAMTDFHDYRVDWTPYAIRGYIDGEKYFEFTNLNQGPSSWPFNHKFHLLLNIAVGGNWGGAQGVERSAFPVKMEVDYVRVYKMIDK